MPGPLKGTVPDLELYVTPLHLIRSIIENGDDNSQQSLRKRKKDLNDYSEGGSDVSKRRATFSTDRSNLNGPGFNFAAMAKGTKDLITRVR